MTVPGQPYAMPYPPPPPAPPARSGWSIAALVLGLLAMFGAISSPPVAILLGVLALSSAIVGLVKLPHGVTAGRGLAIWGLVLGVLAALSGIGQSSNSDTAQSASTTINRPTATAPARNTPAPVQPLPAGTIPGDGTFLVGSDVEPGTYRSTGATEGFFEFCSWTRMRDTTGNSSSTIAFGSANANEPMIVTIQASDGAFKASGCEPFVKIK